MSSIRFIVVLSLISFLVLMSQSLPTSAAEEGGVLVPLRRRVLLQSQPLKAGEKVADGADGLGSFEQRKLGVHIKKAASGGRLARNAGRGASSSSSSAVGNQLSGFHFGSVIGYTLILGFVML